MSRHGALAGLVLGVACTPIRPVPITNAPLNECPCEAFAQEGAQAPQCDKGRCVVPTTSNRPATPFFVVVDVPTSSSYAPGATFVFYADQRGEPAFSGDEVITPGTLPRCVRGRGCLRLPSLTLAEGHYRVSAQTSFDKRYPLPDNTSIPVRVQYAPIGNAQFVAPRNATEAQQTRMAALFAQLPVVPFVAFPRILGETAVVDFRQSLPTGSFLRSFYPEPPFDELFPPRTEVVRVDAGLTTLTDDFFLTNASLDPPRVLDVERDAGLLGWRIWLQDSTTGRRISTVRTLEGTSASVRLDTTNESRTGAGDTLGAVLAPPESSIALPRYVSLAFSGSFGTLAYPPLPSPARVVGEVAEETSEGLLGYAARITFESTEIATLTGQARELLRYSTSVNTDDTGRFSTVLPPGRYTATVAPAEGTGYAVHRQLVTVDRDPTAVTLQPSRLTRIAGRALLVDGRPLAEAEVLATPQTPESDIPRPRSGRTTLGPDGSFEMNLDPGPYAITVIPKRGSGFPRVVIRSVIPAGARPGTPADVATLPDIRIPAPSPLSFRLADPRTEQAVRNALVRVYAVPGAVFGDELEDELPDPEPVEIGIASSNADGQVEILLAPAPR